MYGTARLPEGLRDSLRSEGIVLLAEALPGTVTFRRLKMPGQHASWKRTGIVATVALSAKRFVVYARRFKHIDVPVTEMNRYSVTAAERRPNQLAVTYDLGVTHPDWSGEVELRLRTDQAARITDLLRRYPQSHTP